MTRLESELKCFWIGLWQRESDVTNCWASSCTFINSVVRKCCKFRHFRLVCNYNCESKWNLWIRAWQSFAIVSVCKHRVHRSWCFFIICGCPRSPQLPSATCFTWVSAINVLGPCTFFVLVATRNGTWCVFVRSKEARSRFLTTPCDYPVFGPSYCKPRKILSVFNLDCHLILVVARMVTQIFEIRICDDKVTNTSTILCCFHQHQVWL